ncbi:MaoC family dehydratase [Bosea sp. 124]|uniref:MaoC family dehydratase n=1 Tax=Bosea sp. 124 TaxID=2135642 RepID=UPI000D334BFE|nr:MaoC family dehydratase [Bosea sp. 124]PTM43435.1 acyl dehydratase [Bosea sp. 124]
MTDTAVSATAPAPRKESGLFLEDFEVGQIYRHPFGRTLTETDNSWFCLLTLGMNQVHFNEDYARRTPFGKAIMPSPLTLAVVTGLSTMDFGQNTMANLGWKEVTLPRPVFAGDTLYARTTILAVRKSTKRPSVGIVDVSTQGYNQDGKVVLTFLRTMMVYRRGHSPAAHLPDIEPDA